MQIHDDPLFSTADAAEYLGVSERLIRHNASTKTRNPLFADKIAGHWLFRKSELDRWNARRNPAGRPTGSKRKLKRGRKVRRRAGNIGNTGSTSGGSSTGGASDG